ncbi:MAG: YCF48-related protein [candidate division Zixibacteria bacterium]|nr:YCF48-related protein [candidate division Zixibacteria bacterium]
MKHSLLCLLLLSLVVPALHAQEWQRVKIPAQDNLTGISFISPDTGLVVTGTGRYMHTVDGGKNWRRFRIEEGAPFEDVFYLNSQYAYICGRNGKLLRSIDSLQSWQHKTLPDTLPWLMDIEMFDNKHGLVIGMSRHTERPLQGFALRTVDGGISWQEVAPMGAGYAEIAYEKGGPVIILAFGRLIISDDKGATWRTVTTFEGEACRAISMHGDAGIMAGPGGICAYTRDAGKTWQIVRSDAQRVFIAVQMIDDQVAYVGGANGIVMRTADGGQTWQDEDFPAPIDIFDFELVGDRLYAVGSMGGMLYKKVR